MTIKHSHWRTSRFDLATCQIYFVHDIYPVDLKADVLGNVMIFEVFVLKTFATGHQKSREIVSERKSGKERTKKKKRIVKRMDKKNVEETSKKNEGEVERKKDRRKRVGSKIKREYNQKKEKHRKIITEQKVATYDRGGNRNK